MEIVGLKQKVDEDYIFEHHRRCYQFHERVLRSRRNCILCYKNKVKTYSFFCYTCYQIEMDPEDGCIYCRDVGVGESPLNDSDSD